MQVRRNNAMFDRENDLHQTERARRRHGVPKVGFYRSHRTGPIDPIHLCQTGVFDGITHRRSGAMGLDQPDRVGFHTGDGQRRAACGRLRFRGGVD